MPGATLVRSTLTGVRPLGVRGEPLHAVHEQIRGVVRRRLGERHARLLAEPQSDDAGRRIDWYSEADGTVTPLSSLSSEAQAAALNDVESLTRDIEGLGARLAETSSDDARLLARAVALAVRRPSDDYLFLVGDQPVVVCWGYEAEGAGAIVSAPTLPAIAPVATAPVAVPVAATAAPAIVRRGPVWPALLVGLLGILLLIGAAYWLRQFIPVDPDVAVTQLPPAPALPAPAPPPDPAIGLNKDLGQAQQDGDRLQATLASLRGELAARRAECKPPEPPKPPPAPPPPVVEKKPDPPKPPPKPPQMVEKKPDPPPKPPDDGRLRLPKAPTTDLSFLQGCWRTDPFRHHSQQSSLGVSEYCFDSSGRGSFVFRRGSMTCRTSAQGRYEGTVLRLRDADTRCSDGTTWFQDRLDCTVGADSVAVCRGEASSGLFGGLNRWTVNLHRVR